MCVTPASISTAQSAAFYGAQLSIQAHGQEGRREEKKSPQVSVLSPCLTPNMLSPNHPYGMYLCWKINTLQKTDSTYSEGAEPGAALDLFPFVPT